MARYPLAELAKLAKLEHAGIIELHGDGEVSKLLPVLFERAASKLLPVLLEREMRIDPIPVQIARASLLRSARRCRTLLLRDPCAA